MRRSGARDDASVTDAPVDSSGLEPGDGGEGVCVKRLAWSAFMALAADCSSANLT